MTETTFQEGREQQWLIPGLCRAMEPLIDAHGALQRAAVTAGDHMRGDPARGEMLGQPDHRGRLAGAACIDIADGDDRDFQHLSRLADTARGGAGIKRTQRRQHSRGQSGRLRRVEPEQRVMSLKMKISGKKVSAISQRAQVANGNGALKTMVASNPYAIGYISLGTVDNTVNALAIDGVDATVANVKNGSYKVARPFLVLYKEGKPSVCRTLPTASTERCTLSLARESAMRACSASDSGTAML